VIPERQGLVRAGPGQHTRPVIFDLQDVPATTEKADKRRTRFTVLVAAVLVVVLGVLVVAGVSWIGGRLDQSATRARGEKVLAAVAWPDGWQRQKVDYTQPVPVAGRAAPLWSQRVTTTADSLSVADLAVQDALSAAGWQLTLECRNIDVVEVLCTWRSGDYVLRTQVQAPMVTGQDCPADRPQCERVDVALSLELATDDSPVAPSPS
jgi:hypothetical protein